MWIPHGPEWAELRLVPLAESIDEGREIVRAALTDLPDDSIICVGWVLGCLLVGMFEEALELSDRASAINRRRTLGLLRRLPVWARRAQIERERELYDALTVQLQRREPMRFERVTLRERKGNEYYLPHDKRGWLRLVDFDRNGIRLARWPTGPIKTVAWDEVEEAALVLRQDSFELANHKTSFLRRTVRLNAQDQIWEIDTTWIRPGFRHPQLLEAGIDKYVSLTSQEQSVPSAAG